MKKKSAVHDYAIEAFRFYAREGGPDAYAARMWQPALLDPGEGGQAARAALEDLRAVARTLARLGEEDETGLAGEALRLVYMAQPDAPLRRGDIRDRVSQAQFGLHISEAALYRHLARARTLFAQERGLRLGGEPPSDALPHARSGR